MSVQGHVANGERRANPRHYALEEQIVVVDLGCDNGGILLNCSRGGIAIQAVGPVPQCRGSELLLYLPDAPKPVRAVGDVVWADEFHQAGICFAPQGTAQLGEWLEQTAHRHFFCLDNITVPQTHTANACRLDNLSVEKSVEKESYEILPDDAEPGQSAFFAAAVLSFILTLLCSFFLRRPTSMPSLPADHMQQPVLLQHNAASGPIPVNAFTPKPLSVSPAERRLAAPSRKIGSRSRRVRRSVQGEHDDEVIVRHFTRPTPATAAREQQP